MRGMVGYLGIAAVCVAFLGCGEREASQGGESAVAEAYAPIAELPTLDAEVFKKLREQAISEGKVLVVDFWATWCVSCVQMFPQLHEAMHEREEQVMLVSVTQDGEEDMAKAIKFLNRNQAGQNAYWQDSESISTVAEAVGQEGWGGGVLPAVFVFDTRGELVYAMTETRGDPEDWVAAIAQAADSASP